MCCSRPSPPQAGQAPNGLLNENSRGSISGMVKPDTGQANFSEKIRRSALALRPRLAAAPDALVSASSTTARPSASLRHCSSESASRVPMSDFTTSRSTTTSMSWVNFLSSGLTSLDFVERAVDLDALIALAQEFGEFLFVFALAAAHDRRQHIDARAVGQRQHAVDHLRHGLAFDRQTSGRRVGHADARPQQAHVVVDLGDGADGRARVFRGGLLLDGDGRRQAVDLVDVRLLHHLQELPRIGRQALDIAALALGIDGVEGERRLAGTRQAGEHDQLVARNGDVDVLQIVLARAADGDHAGVGGLGSSDFSVMDSWRRRAAAWNVVRTTRFCQCTRAGRLKTRICQEIQCRHGSGEPRRATRWRRSVHGRSRSPRCCGFPRQHIHSSAYNMC